MKAIRYADETVYERTQRHNALTRWLHSRRYRNVVSLLRELARETPDRPIRVVEIGSAVSKLYDVLDPIAPIDYLGVELDGEFCRIARERHARRSNFRVLQGSASDPALDAELGRPDLLCALETLEHIPEHEVVRIVERMARLQPRLLVCSGPIEIGPSIVIKNVGSLLVGYARAKNRPWREVFWAGLYQLDRIPPHGTGHGGFDWRWLAQTIRHNMRIREIRKSPFTRLPAALSFSFMIVAEPRIAGERSAVSGAGLDASRASR